MHKSTKIMIAAMIGLITLGLITIIFIVEPAPNTIVQHPVETVAFVKGEQANKANTFVKTDRENLLIPIYNIDFISSPTVDTLTLDEIQSTRHTNGVQGYNLHIPEAQIDDITSAYKKALGTEIVFKTEGRDES